MVKRVDMYAHCRGAETVTQQLERKRNSKITYHDWRMIELTCWTVGVSLWFIGGFVSGQFWDIGYRDYLKWSGIIVLGGVGGAFVACLVAWWWAWASDFWKRWRA